MNQIKFRAWDPIDKKMWFTGQEGETDEKTDGTFQTFFDENGFLTAKLLWIDDVGYENPIVTDRDLTLMHYTGLNDILDEEIFEADYIRDIQGNLWKVILEDGSFCAYHEDYGMLKYLIDLVKNHCEVVGDMFRNSEILGETE